MKFHLEILETGKWVGGFQCRRSEVKTMLEDTKPLAMAWSEALDRRATVRVTRVDRQGQRKGQPLSVEIYYVDTEGVFEPEW